MIQVEVPAAATADVPFSDRLDGAVWRGAPSGGRSEHSLRGKVVAYCRGRPWADAAFVEEHNRLSRDAQARYKVLLLIDGNAWASSWEWALASGSVCIWIGVWWLHLHTELVPWPEPGAHYVPAATDLSDLEERVQWVLGHPEESAAIAQRAKQLFNRVASPEYTRSYIADMCLKVATADASAREDRCCQPAMVSPN